MISVNKQQNIWCNQKQSKHMISNQAYCEIFLTQNLVKISKTCVVFPLQCFVNGEVGQTRTQITNFNRKIVYLACKNY